MNIDRDQILQLLHQRGDSGASDQAQQELPGQLDTDNPDHQNLLQNLGLNPADLIGKLTGGNSSEGGAGGESGGGLGGAIGKLL